MAEINIDFERKKISKLQQERATEEGRFQELMKRLKSEHGVDTLDGAREELKKRKDTVKENLDELKKHLSELSVMEK